ncbi:MAG: glycosyltransferase family 4 protein [Verrucomicrobia bacterium]|nr:glycosyltransferase family 4 protein [Verrucomicrobiota bacterium]
MRILILTNLYPPLHAGTHDVRCQTVADALTTRSHVVQVLTSNHGIRTEQKDEEIRRQLLLNGEYGHRAVSRFSDLRSIELHNHRLLWEALEEFRPNLVYVWGMRGLNKSLIFALNRARVPTVYDVGDFWISRQLSRDPWLRWWNGDDVSPLCKAARWMLGLSLIRKKIDVLTPTGLNPAAAGVNKMLRDGERMRRLPPLFMLQFRWRRMYFCSEALKEETLDAGYDVENAPVFYPGIQTQRFGSEVKPPDARVEKLLIVGSMDETSGAMSVLEALRLCRERGRNIKLSIYGKGETDYMARLKSFVVRHQLPVDFLTVSDPHRDLPKVYRSHDLLIYPVETDVPYAITPLEAMAAGLPVIVSDIKSVLELVEHRENGLVFHRGNVEELAAGIQVMSDDGKLRSRLAGNAQAMVFKQFDESMVFDRIEEFLETSLETWSDL